MNSVAVASFDALFITKNLSSLTQGLTQDEISVFSYLACLLSLYDSKQPSWWQYSFTATEAGYPSSDTLREACSLLVAAGSLAKHVETLELTSVGDDDVDSLARFGSYQPRIPYLAAACSTALTQSLPSIGDSISADPQLRSALLSSQVKPLLDRTGAALLQPYIDGLQNAMDSAGVGSHKEDLLVPAMVWISYFAHEKSLSQ
jgi:hypothetical protein